MDHFRIMIPIGVLIAILKIVLYAQEMYAKNVKMAIITQLAKKV